MNVIPGSHLHCELIINSRGSENLYFRVYFWSFCFIFLIYLLLFKTFFIIRFYLSFFVSLISCTRCFELQSPSYSVISFKWLFWLALDIFLPALDNHKTIYLFQMISHNPSLSRPLTLITTFNQTFPFIIVYPRSHVCDNKD